MSKQRTFSVVTRSSWETPMGIHHAGVAGPFNARAEAVAAARAARADYPTGLLLLIDYRGEQRLERVG